MRARGRGGGGGGGVGGGNAIARVGWVVVEGLWLWEF